MTHNAVISGLGFISCLGNDATSVEDSLRTLHNGLSKVDFLPGVEGATRLVGKPSGFTFPSAMYLSWTMPSRYKLPRELMRSLNPHGVYAACAALQALEDAKLSTVDISDGRTALFCASAGSPWLLSRNIQSMHEAKVLHGAPFGVISGISGTLNFNLGSFLKIKGGNCGFVSACTSSTHALGYALDEIRLGRHDRVLVIGAEEDMAETVLPFAAMRVLSDSLDPAYASCPFDKARSGFTASSGAVAIVVENEEAAMRRGASIWARMLGWWHCSDGYSPAQPAPGGEGVLRAMKSAIEDAGLTSADIDYVNAHATSTPAGDAAEASALSALFADSPRQPAVSSTKALTGHGLSLAGAQETAFCALSLKKGFIPGCANLREPCEEAARLNLPRTSVDYPIRNVLKNNCGFGGSNVSLVLGRY